VANARDNKFIDLRGVTIRSVDKRTRKIVFNPVLFESFKLLLFDKRERLVGKLMRKKNLQNLLADYASARYVIAHSLLFMYTRAQSLVVGFLILDLCSVS
jgi:hypothetical protein